ncbi:Uncharacterised protein [Segatella copri]|nr:Uncharacterised protein [Segatella copri]
MSPKNRILQYRSYCSLQRINSSISGSHLQPLATYSTHAFR